MPKSKLQIRGAREHNLKNLNLDIPRDQLVVITGVSGSGKSTLAFDTIYAEGQRRYVESLSAYARQFLDQMSKPDVDAIEGLSPAIAIEQKTTSKNPRSTVATVTEIYDYLRLLYARIGRPACPNCEKPVSQQTAEQMVDRLMKRPVGTKLVIMAPLIRGRKGEYRQLFAQLRRDGFARVRIDQEIHPLGENIVLDKRKKHDIDVVVDRIVVKAAARQRIADSVELALKKSEGLLRIQDHKNNKEDLWSEKLSCLACGISMPEIEPRTFSFNSPQGACETCSGLGQVSRFDEALIIVDPTKSLADGVIAPWTRKVSWYGPVLQALCSHYKQSYKKAWNKLPEKFRHVVLHGSGEVQIKVVFRGEDSRYSFKKPFEGVLPSLRRRMREAERDKVRERLLNYQRLSPCVDCSGTRLRPEARAVSVGGIPIYEFTAFPIEQALKFVDELALSETEAKIGERVLKEIRERLGFLNSVGLSYLSLDRKSGSLSGGESQRIRLATQIGSSLVGVLYILDEPSIGLHQRDNARLLKTLMRLRDLGNTVLVVEHDEDTINASDWVIDMGPGAGHHGGEVVCAGRPASIKKNKRSLTGQYLSGARSIAVPEQRRTPKPESVWIRGARGNNLQNIDVQIPLGIFLCVTGVSGSGKSTLINDTLYKAVAKMLYSARANPAPHDKIEGLDALDKVIDIDQSPIGRTPRSNPATYTGLFGGIRDIFSALPESKVRGYKAGRFSFNVKGGRCESCEGDGVIRIEMHFLPDVYVTCEACRGRRYNRETLEVFYKGSSIADVLAMTVKQALAFFSAVPSIRRKLQTLDDVGLGYIHLGQQATTLSGGEAQRVKLSKELSKRSTGRTLFVLDEPTTGLHFADVEKLLEVLHRLVDQGNTVIVIEHNLDVIKTADWIIDLGPEGGTGGGQVLVEGPPEIVAAQKTSHTGQFLKPLLKRLNTAKKKAKKTVR
jgi:excinuclease ABC subunit A